MGLSRNNIPIIVVGLILTIGLAAGIAVAGKEQAINEQVAQKRQQTSSLLDSIPAPSDASRTNYQTIAVEGQQQFTGEWITSASVLNVANYYSKILPENDWSITSDQITNQNQTTALLTATKENRIAFISLTRNQKTNTTTISIAIPSITNAVPLSISSTTSTSNKPIDKNTELENSASTKIAFIANTGVGTNFTHILNLIKSEQAEYVIHAGDFDLQSNPALFSSVISSILGEAFPYLYVLGDQDIETDLWYENCTRQDACYSSDLIARAQANDITLTFPDEEDLFDTYSANLGSIHIVALGLGDLDTSNQGIGSKIYTPFITKSFTDSKAPLKICVFHETMFEAQVGNQIDSIGWKPFEACREQGALIITGSDHSYSRTRTLLSYPERTTSQIWNKNDMVRLEPGTSFLANVGLGGASFNLQERCKPISPPYGCQGEWASIYSMNQAAQPGVLFLEIDDNQETLASAYFKNINNQLIDSFSISIWKPGAQLTEIQANNDTRVLSANDSTCLLSSPRSLATSKVSASVCN